jgi:hypothetical protein
MPPSEGRAPLHQGKHHDHHTYFINRSCPLDPL